MAALLAAVTDYLPVVTQIATGLVSIGVFPAVYFNMRTKAEAKDAKIDLLQTEVGQLRRRLDEVQPYAVEQQLHKLLEIGDDTLRRTVEQHAADMAAVRNASAEERRRLEQDRDARIVALARSGTEHVQELLAASDVEIEKLKSQVSQLYFQLEYARNFMDRATQHDASYINQQLRRGIVYDDGGFPASNLLVEEDHGDPQSIYPPDEPTS